MATFSDSNKGTETTTEPLISVESGVVETLKGESELIKLNAEQAAKLISTGKKGSFLRIQKLEETQSSQAPSARNRFQTLPKTNLKMSIRLSEPLRNGSLESELRKVYLPAISRGLKSEKKFRQGLQKRHLLKYANPNHFINHFHSPSSQSNLNTLYHSGQGILPNYVVNEFGYEAKPTSDTGSIKNGEGQFEIKQNYNTEPINHLFYLGSQELIYITYKVFNAVLYFKYFEQLRLTALEMELNTGEYNLMILLPDFDTDVMMVAASLNFEPTLRHLRKQLKPRLVQATIPDFHLHGRIVLTNDLQNMGISDIFEPHRADFRPMTDTKTVYVKHIDQFINVHIRTYPIHQSKRHYAASQLRPIQIEVNRPFLFLVTDRDLEVAVMAGRILNPLNMRIQ